MDIMDRTTTDSLAKFCAAQRSHFERDDWLAWSDINGSALALAAKYLSMTSWYGHEEELEEIAKRKDFSEQSTGLYQESKAINFDLPYFSAKVRVNVARGSKNAMDHADNGG